MRRLLAVLVVLSYAAPVLAEDDIDPIDAALDECFGGGEGPNDVQMLECVAAAHKAWDEAMNAALVARSRGLDPGARERLAAAQRQWIAFRDAEQAFWLGFPDAAIETMKQIEAH